MKAAYVMGPGLIRRVNRRHAIQGAAALAALLLLAGCGEHKGGAMPPVPVTAAKAVQKDVPVVLTAIGTVEAYNTVGIKALIGGQLTKVHFKEGQDVKKGAPLFTIDPRPYQSALKAAEAALARDRAKAASAEAEARRYADLVKKDYVTQQQFDDTSANAEAMKATVAADEAAVENARLNLAYCFINAPVDGRMGNLMVREGNLIKANADNPMVTLNQITPVYVTFSVPEDRLSEIRREAAAGTLAVRAAFPDQDDVIYTGELTFIDNAVSAGSGTILLKATFSNTDKALWPGQFVNVRLTLSTRKGAVVVPENAVQEGQQGYYVFVVKPDTSVEMRPVEVGQRLGGEALIEKGVDAGEEVVTDGQLRLYPGAKVQIKAGLGAEENAGAAPKGDH
jgi:multidrug efflux system membrane fusion protein